METGKELVKKETPPSFIEKLMLNSNTLEEVKKVGEVIIASGFCPDHFKQSKDAVGVVMCIEAGRQLGLTWMQALSDLYPVKGRIGMMGAGARSLIFSSGVLDKWEEQTEGNYPDDTYKHIIISKRKGLPGEFRSEFSVYDAKKAGLFTKDIYQRYGKRMIMWRNIGFHATDYYGDIMKGMKTVEELNDFDVIPGVGDTTIEKEDGTKLNIQGGAKHKSGKMTDTVASKIPANKFGAVNEEHIQEATVITKDQEMQAIIDNLPEKKVGDDPEEFITRYNEYVDNALKQYPELNLLKLRSEKEEFVPQRGSASQMNGVITHEKTPGNGGQPPEHLGQYTEAELEEMPTDKLKDMVMNDMDMMESSQMIPGKNTKKKLKEIILAHQAGTLAKLVADNMPKTEGENKSGEPVSQGTSTEILPNKNFDNEGQAGGVKGNSGGELFEGDTSKSNPKAGNKYGLIIPEKTPRDFAEVKALFNKLMGLTPQITTPRFLELLGKIGLQGSYQDKETFIKMSSVDEFNKLLEAN